MKRKRLLICCRHDSFIKASYPIRDVFLDHNYQVDYFLVTDRAVIDPKHLDDIGFHDDYKCGSLDMVLKPELLSTYDGLLLSMQGPGIFRVMRYLALDYPSGIQRPVVFAGYCGIVYEKQALGLMDRQGLDIFFVNSEYDFQIFSQILDEVGVVDRDNIVVTGLPLLDLSFNQSAPTPLDGEFRSLLFAGQPTVPEKLSERHCIAQAMVEFCKKYPEKIVYFKPRHKPNQDSVHKTQWHYQRIFEKIAKKEALPSNLIITYEPILDLLEKVDLCLTVSSTAAFEAVNKGVPVGFLMDFGIREDYGTTFFAGSGCGLSLGQLFAPLKIIPDEKWWKSRYFSDGNNSLRLFSEVDTLVDRSRSLNTPLPIRYNYKLETSNYYFEFLKKRNELSYSKKITDFLHKAYYYLHVKGILE